MKARWTASYFWVALVLLLTSHLHADVLIGVNGERFYGRVLAETEESVIFQSDLGGRITIPKEDILEIQRPGLPQPSAKTEPNLAPYEPSRSFWRKSVLPDDNFDWIELYSGEWLKGRIKAMQNQTLEFDSKELELLSFDWEDVYQVRSARDNEVLFNDRSLTRGQLLITRDQVTILGTETNTIPRGNILGIAPSARRELDHWTAKISVGLTLRDGNTTQTELNTSAKLQRRTPATRLTLDYLGYYSETADIQTANSHRSSALFDVWLSRRFFIRAPFLEYYRDPFTGIAHRVTAGIGVGYDIVDHRRLEWNVTAGPAYQHTWFESVLPGDDPDVGAAALVLGTQFDWEISSRLDLILRYSGQYTSREAGETTHHGVATLEVELTRILDVDISFIWDRVSNPKTGADGLTPKPDDFRLVFGLALDY